MKTKLEIVVRSKKYSKKSEKGQENERNGEL